MKFRPLNTIAILLAAFGAIEAGRLGLKATQAIAEGSGHEPVSYTHLDVYKRQA